MATMLWERGYPGLAETYDRFVMMVEAGKEEVYVVDLFRVKGGSQHDWVIHGSADVDQTANTDLAMKPIGNNMLPGVEVRLPDHERDRGEAAGRNVNYAFFQNVLKGEGENGKRVTFKGDQGVSVRTHLLSGADGETFLGDAPSIRRADEDATRLNHFRMPIILHRRKGSSPLTSQFLAVHEPYSEKPFLDNVELVESGDGYVRLKIQHGKLTDHILLCLNPGKKVSSDIEFDGEVGFVREQGDTVLAMGMWGGMMLRWKNHTLRGGGILSGRVTETTRIAAGDSNDGLVFDGYVQGGELEGATVVVKFGDGTTLGYVIKGAEEQVLNLDSDPGFQITDSGMEHLFFPLRKIDGPVRFEIRTSLFATFESGRTKVSSIGGPGQKLE